MTDDISKSWRDGNFGIIEINAGPGVFMHLVPAYGASIDVPGKIMEAHFGRPECSRIPIVAGNCIDLDLANKIFQYTMQVKPDVCFASLTGDGVYRDGAYVCNNEDYDVNIMLKGQHWFPYSHAADVFWNTGNQMECFVSNSLILAGA